MREFGPRPARKHPDPRHWDQVRAAALARDQGCRLCGAGDELEVHHRTYRRWGQERLADLTVLCRGCHDLITGAQMRRRDARRSPPPDRRVTVSVERLPVTLIPAQPQPARRWREIERPVTDAAGDALPPPARGPR